jgi:phosphatidylglycerol---prolipoprotein diacylglyceryl transferase
VYPQLFHFGSFWLPTYGFLVALGVFLGLIVASKLASGQGVDSEKAWNLGIIAILSAIIGAKVLLILIDWHYYMAHPREIFSMATWQAGGVFYGGLIAAVAASVWYIRRNRLPVLRTSDAFAPGIALGHVFGRFGCFSAGCCFGKPTNLPWGVKFTNPLANTISGTPLNVRIHPTELYEALVELINFFILYWMIKHKKFEGQVIGAYLALYGVARFFLEFLRDDPGRGSVFGGAMSGTQLISIFMVIAGGILWIYRKPIAAPVPAPTTAPVAAER